MLRFLVSFLLITFSIACRDNIKRTEISRALNFCTPEPFCRSEYRAAMMEKLPIYVCMALEKGRKLDKPYFNTALAFCLRSQLCCDRTFLSLQKYLKTEKELREYRVEHLRVGEYSKYETCVQRFESAFHTPTITFKAANTRDFCPELPEVGRLIHSNLQAPEPAFIDKIRNSTLIDTKC